MTITYTAEVSTSNFSSFARTLFRWKGSIWKAVIFEFILWSIFYIILTLVYRLALSDPQKRTFESVCLLCYQYIDFIPITFMMGFFVSLVVTRWWTMFNHIGWIDNFGLLVASYVKGVDEKGRRIRRSIIRYVCLCQVLIFRSISIRVRKRFPTLDSLIVAGYIDDNERSQLEDLKFWMPIRWAMHLIRDARVEGRITSENAVQTLYEYVCKFRADIQSLWFTDWVPVPLVYTQVIFVSVRLYFIVALLGRQFLDVEHQSSRGPIDAYVPFITIIQIVCYTGWSKVAEALLNPFGEDDDDFECNWIIDRNLQVGLTIVDDKPEVIPPLVTDKFWNDANAQLLYSVQTAALPQNPNVGSAALIMRSVSSTKDVTMVPRMKTSQSHAFLDPIKRTIFDRRCSMPEKPPAIMVTPPTPLNKVEMSNVIFETASNSTTLDSDGEAEVSQSVSGNLEHSTSLQEAMQAKTDFLQRFPKIRRKRTLSDPGDTSSRRILTEKMRKESVLSCVDEGDELKKTYSTASLDSGKEHQGNHYDSRKFAKMIVDESEPMDRSTKGIDEDTVRGISNMSTKDVNDASAKGRIISINVDGKLPASVSYE